MDKYQLVSTFQKRVANPLIRWILLRGVSLPGHALLETIGRKSGQARRIPVGEGLEGDTFWIIAEHGRRAAYVRNIEANPCVRVKVRGQWRSGTAYVMPEDDPRERQRKLSHNLSRRLNAAAVRALGTELLTVRIDLNSSEAATG
ncbi:nitroreductase/quinone reductase family protein [Streptomyces sp. KR80]|uniref:nitroreductase/quinone reductase family protein n=1 Tax=Streptomyces sp. KR80 TaxID=3457426 RepID=UPI003FD05721